MKNELIKKVLPHFIAILIFLVISVIFCKPALEGNTLDQHDIAGWKGMAQNALEYKEKYGHYPLWNPNAFSGMPNFMIIMNGKSILPDITGILTLGLPQPISFFFLACLCFYILCMTLGARPIVGIFGALAFGFATYNPIIIAAGHITKMFAIAYMPLLLAGLILLFEKKYWLGLAVTTLGTYLQISANHPQISYYLIIVTLAVTIAYLVNWIRQKEWKHIGIVAGFALVAVLAGVLANSLSFLVTREYSKATIRGGKTVEIQGTNVTPVKLEGLDTSYAFDYSLAKAEAVTVLMPNAFGGSGKERLDEESKVTEKLVDRGIPEANAAQLSASLPKFWGDPSSTAGGPLYSGIIVCLLAFIGFLLYKHPVRWGLLVVSILGLFMAWGKNFEGFNLFLFENLPLYNKFRAPSITMVIIQLVIPIAAVLGMTAVFYRDQSREMLKKDFKKILYTLSGAFLILLMMYFGLEYSAPFDREILSQYGASGNDEIGRLIVSALKAERKALFGGQLLRTFAFMLVVIALLWMYMKNVLNRNVTIGILAFISIVDQLLVDKNYLNEENYRPKDEVSAEMTTKNPVDEQILADTSKHYRVYYAGQDRFSASDYHTSTYHKAIGGYHPAKLRLYQDVIQRYLSGASDPQQVLNMLNAKYIVVPNPQTGQPTLVTNPEANGPCWFVKGIKVVSNDVEELQSLGVTNLKDTAVIQQSLASGIAQPQWDSASSIILTKFDNDAVEYSANCSGLQFAVFSEVYYPYGWNAYLDGKKVDYVKTNYVLRGMPIPAGQHTIRFAFEPSTYKTGLNLAFYSSILIAILVLGGFFMAWRTRKKQIPDA